MKGVEIGLGFDAAALPRQRGARRDRPTGQNGYARVSNNAGGIEGGSRTGAPIVAARLR